MPRAVLSRARQQAVRRVAHDSLAQFPACSAAAVAVVGGATPALLAGTSLLAHQLETAQWELGEGPGVDAVRQLQVFNVSSLLSVTAWPDFAELATSRGVMSVLAVPITWRGRPLGALGLYSSEPDGFAGQEVVGLRSATAAALALSAALERHVTEPEVVPAPAERTHWEQVVS